MNIIWRYCNKTKDVKFFYNKSSDRSHGLNMSSSIKLKPNKEKRKCIKYSRANRLGQTKRHMKVTVKKAEKKNLTALERGFQSPMGER